MRYLRALAVVCLAFGLFVQVSAQAAATPQAQPASMMDCSEMAQSGHGTATEEPSDMDGPCDMTLGCLVAMNCIPPIALIDPVSVDALLPSVGVAYQADAAVRLKSSLMRPESPPPQAALTA